MVRFTRKRRFKRKGRSTRYRRSRRRIRGSRRLVKGRSGHILHVRRSTQSTLVTHAAGVTGAAFYTATYFQLTDLINYAELANLFSQYRYNCVVVTITPDCDVNQYSNLPATNKPIIGWCLDYEDAVAPTALAELQEYDNYHETTFDKTITIKIYPTVTTLAYISPSTHGYAVRRRTWLRSAQPDVHHYGLKYCVYNLASNQTAYWRVKYTAYISVKGLH